MSWYRHYFYCEGCNGTWLAEAEITVTADCPFCAARDAFPYRSDERRENAASRVVVALEAVTNSRRRRANLPKPPHNKVRAKAASR